MNHSIEIYEDTCVEYQGFTRQILLLNDKKVLINICKEYSNEKGWNFSKIYPDKDLAIKSLVKYIKKLDSLKIEDSDKSIFNYADVVSKLNSDILKKAIFLPDDGIGYKYH